MASEPTPAKAGLIVFNKPSGPTSFDCVHRVRHFLGGIRTGHCGTLDPLAEGVLLLLYGPATRRQEEFLSLEKEYRFRAHLGVLTHTGDSAGTVLERRPIGHISLQMLKDAIAAFRGPISQKPHRVSAVKYQGKRLYEWTRKGVDVPRTPRQVAIHEIEIVSFDPPFWEGRVVCSRGTYVRSLVEDIAESMGSVASLDQLSRERIGSYCRADALRLEDLHSMGAENVFQATSFS